MRLLLPFLLSLSLADGYKILMFVPTVSRSNLIFYMRISDLLTAAGHNVTLYRPHYTDTVLSIKSETATEVRVPGPDREIWHRMEKMENAQAWNDYHIFTKLQQEFIATFLELMESSCEAQASNFEVLERLRNENYDLAVANMYEACPFGLIHVLKIKSFLYLSSSVMNEAIAGIAGLPATPSFVPGMLTDFSDKMNYWERTQNFIGRVMMDFAAPSIFKCQEKAFIKHHGADFPPLTDLAAKSQLYFINSEELIDFPRPILHKTIYIGGIGMKNPKPLSKKWKEIAEKSQDGVVLMSFGSVVNGSAMPVEWKKAILRSFAQFPTYTFIFKYEFGDLVELPEAKTLNNLYIESWVPQTDILGHSKTKAFITHGGYNSVLEAANAGVPLVCMALFGDQFRNCKAAERHGYGAVVQKTTAHDSKYMTEALRTVLGDNSYLTTAKTLSRMMKKKATNSEELIVKWTEFLAEFQEIPNLEVVGAEMGFIKYNCLDVIAGLVGVLVLVLAIVVKILMTVLRFFCNVAGKTKRD